MNPDDPFRMVLTVGSVIVFSLAGYYSFRYQLTDEKLDRRREGFLILFPLRFAGLFCILGMGLYLVEPNWMDWSSVALPGKARWAGISLGIVGGGLLLWTLHSLGRNLTDTVVTRREHTLVTAGPYRWVRNPFYDALGICILGFSMAAANWFILLAGALAILLIVVRLRKEEAELRLRFGEAYRDYVAGTGRFLPRLRVR